MSGDKHHFGFLVKDDFKRFFHPDKLLSTGTNNTHDCRDRTRQQVYLLVKSDFQAITVFQRYPDILVRKCKTYQQFNKYI